MSKRAHHTKNTFSADAVIIVKYLSIDILVHLTESTKVYKFILVMTDRFSKMVRAVPIQSISASSVSKVLVQDWVFVHILIRDLVGQW